MTNLWKINNTPNQLTENSLLNQNIHLFMTYPNLEIRLAQKRKLQILRRIQGRSAHIQAESLIGDRVTCRQQRQWSCRPVGINAASICNQIR